MITKVLILKCVKATLCFVDRFLPGAGIGKGSFSCTGRRSITSCLGSRIGGCRLGVARRTKLSSVVAKGRVSIRCGRGKIVSGLLGRRSIFL